MSTFLQIPLTGESPFWDNAVASAAALPASGQITGSVILAIAEAALYYWDGAAWQLFIDGLADVSGPASSTDNAVARFNGTTGKVIQNSVVTIGDTGDTAGIGALSAASAVLAAPLPVASGGTASSSALSNNRVMKSSAGTIIEAAAITASRALASDSNGIPVAAATTATELGYVNGVTSAIQTQIDTKAAGAASSTDNAFARFDTTTGKIIQNSGVICDDSNNVTGVAQLNATLAKVGAAGALTASCAFEVSSTTGAFMLPRMTTTQRDALTPAAGMLLLNTTTNRMEVYLAAPVSAWCQLPGWGNP